LEFEGGSISGEYTITGQNTAINAGLVKIFGTDVTLTGTWKASEAHPEWFGAVGDGVTDDYSSIQKTINTFQKVVFTKGIYIISQTLEIAAEKTVVGTIEANNENTIRIKATSDITMVRFTGNNSLFQNFTLEHPSTNTEPVVVISDRRYLEIKNIFCSHNGEACPAIGLYAADTTWSGYNLIERCNFSLYSHCVKIDGGTLYDFMDSIFNSGSVSNLKLSGSIFVFRGCDISLGALGVDYTGRAIVDFIGCYMEGYYRDTFAKVTSTQIGATVRINGTLLQFNENNTSYEKEIKATKYSDDRFYEPKLLPDYFNGFHSTVNKVVNGDFSLGFIKWTFASAVTGTQITSGLPDGFKTGASFTSTSNAGEPYQTIGKLSKGWHTLCMWVKIENPTESMDFNVLIAESLAGSAAVCGDYRIRYAGYKQGWMFVNVAFFVPETAISKSWIIRLYYAGIVTLSITGIGIYDGMCAENGSGNSCSEDIVATKSLILKGDDGNYYTISVNSGGDLVATQI
jgi:hypothetical protein